MIEIYGHDGSLGERLRGGESNVFSALRSNAPWLGLRTFRAWYKFETTVFGLVCYGWDEPFS